MASRVTGTADGPMVIVALEQAEASPLVRDDVAIKMTPPAVRGMIALTRWPPLRRMMINASEREMPGLWGGMLCRKRYVDDCMSAALADGISEVVILGAGLDTLAYRRPEPKATRVYEVDLPANIDRKRARLRGLYGEVPGHVELVPLDFDREDLAAALAAHGHAMDSRTLFVWEAVTQYLTEAGVRATLGHISAAAPGSRLVFTYVRQDFLDGTDLYGAPRAHRRFAGPDPLWRFGLRPEDVAPFLSEYGWREVEQLGPDEYAERYLKPAHRDLDTTGIERSVLAERT